MGSFGMDKCDPGSICPRTGSLVEEGNPGRSEPAHRFVQVRYLEADMVDAFPPLLQETLQGVARLCPLYEFDLGPPDGEEGDLCPLCLDHLGPLPAKAEDLFKEPGRLIHAPHGDSDVRYTLNHGYTVMISRCSPKTRRSRVQISPIVA